MSIEEYQDFTTVYANGFYNGEEKWKNKIRAKIKEYNKTREQTNDDDIYDAMVNYIDVLNDLLEED